MNLRSSTSIARTPAATVSCSRRDIAPATPTDPRTWVCFTRDPPGASVRPLLNGSRRRGYPARWPGPYCSPRTEECVLGVEAVRGESDAGNSLAQREQPWHGAARRCRKGRGGGSHRRRDVAL